MGQKTQAGLGKSGPPSVDEAIAALAGRQHGVVATRQLRALGLSTQAISQRVATGRLHRVHRGAFAVGHRLLTERGRWMAAVLACGPVAVLSHVSAAALWGIRYSESTSVDVTVPRTGRVPRGVIRVHRSRSLPTSEVTSRHAIPVTTVPRTVLDLAQRLSPAHLENLLNEVERRELTDYPALDALARAHTGHRGAPKLLNTMQTHDAGTNLTRSDLEILFRQLCKDHELPEPKVNRIVQGKEVDFLFEDARLIVEADSWAYHKTRRAFEADRARDVLTARAGYRTLRFTDRQLATDPAGVASALRDLLRPHSSASQPSLR